MLEAHHVELVRRALARLPLIIPPHVELRDDVLEVSVSGHLYLLNTAEEVDDAVDRLFDVGETLDPDDVEAQASAALDDYMA